MAPRPSLPGLGMACPGVDDAEEAEQSRDESGCGLCWALGPTPQPFLTHEPVPAFLPWTWVTSNPGRVRPEEPRQTDTQADMPPASIRPVGVEH